jgi:hypothetical protein
VRFVGYLYVICRNNTLQHRDILLYQTGFFGDTYFYTVCALALMAVWFDSFIFFSECVLTKRLTIKSDSVNSSRGQQIKKIFYSFPFPSASGSTVDFKTSISYLHVAYDLLICERN